MSIHRFKIETTTVPQRWLRQKMLEQDQSLFGVASELGRRNPPEHCPGLILRLRLCDVKENINLCLRLKVAELRRFGAPQQTRMRRPTAGH
jgi:hypothetical protein